MKQQHTKKYFKTETIPHNFQQRRMRNACVYTSNNTSMTTSKHIRCVDLKMGVVYCH